MSVWTAEAVAMLGTMSDAALGRRLGVSGETVRQQRQKRGVQAAAGPRAAMSLDERRKRADAYERRRRR